MSVIRRFADPLLRRLGIDVAQFWLLMELFEKLTDRCETMNQLGRDKTTMKVVSRIYFGMTAVMSILVAVAGPPLVFYFGVSLAVTAMMLLAVLVTETSNSLINPVEGLVLAHQPINGSTYTAAKLAHLLFILAYLVPGLNLAPALAGLALPGARWYYPLVHMAAASALGLLLALGCCALFGWLIRFLPPARVKRAAQIVEAMPWLLFVLGQYSRPLVTFARKHQLLAWWPRSGAPLVTLAVAAGAAAIAVFVLGLRALSGDYLVRVAGIAHGGSSAKSKPRRSIAGEVVARFSGGPTCRAGFEYVRRLMLRDLQFLRQMIGLIPMLAGLVAMVVGSWKVSPFSGRFSYAQVLPHVIGFTGFMLAQALPQGSDHKAAWIFRLAPDGAFRGLARGVWALLWLRLVVLPHVVFLAIYTWAWGIGPAALFVAYSTAVATVYVTLEMRLIEWVPFSKQVDTKGNAMALPLLMAGAIVTAAAVAAQHFLIFRSELAVVAATVALAATAVLLRDGALESYEVSMRFHLQEQSMQSRGLFLEIDS